MPTFLFPPYILLLRLRRKIYLNVFLSELNPLEVLGVYIPFFQSPFCFLMKAYYYKFLMELLRVILQLLSCTG